MASASPLGELQLKVLASLCDTFFPSCTAPPGCNEDVKRAFNSSLGENVGYMRALHDSILSLDESKIVETKVLLSTLSTSVGTVILFGSGLLAFPDRSLEERTQNLLDLMTSRFETKRKVFVGLKRLILGLAYSYLSEDGENDYWGSIEYEGPPIVKEKDKAHVEKLSGAFDGHFINSHLGDLHSTQSRSSKSDSKLPSVLVYDYVIIGSGAGGGVAAETFASAGFSCLVLEKSAPIRQEDMTQVESHAFGSLYEKNGLLTTNDGNMIIMAGSGLGGGTSINWACCLDTPDYVRQEWVTKHGLAQFSVEEGKSEFDAALDSVKKTIGVSDKNVVHNVANQILIDGCSELGLDWKVAPQNFKTTDDANCGWTCFGDKFGNKQGTQVTYLTTAAESGNCSFLTCLVNRILPKEKEAGFNGVEATVTDFGEGREHLKCAKMRIMARKAIICSAGSLHTPGILKRSGFKNRHIGKHLRLHPVTGIIGEMDSVVKGYQGAPMTTVCTADEMGPDGDGYGAKIECPSAHVGLMASCLPWEGGEKFKRDMLPSKNSASIIMLQRDFGEGTVDVGEDGVVDISYRLCEKDKKSMMASMRTGMKIFQAAGARRIATLNATTQDVRTRNGKETIDDDQIDALCENVENTGINVNSFGVFTAHQMGSCRMGLTSDDGVVDEDGELWECDGVYVMDASIFPTASGSNPMMTTLAMSRMLSVRLLNRHRGLLGIEETRKSRRKKDRDRLYTNEVFTQVSFVTLVVGLMSITWWYRS